VCDVPWSLPPAGVTGMKCAMLAKHADYYVASPLLIAYALTAYAIAKRVLNYERLISTAAVDISIRTIQKSIIFSPDSVTCPPHPHINQWPLGLHKTR